MIFFTVSVCKVFSRRFLAPLLTALEQIKSDRRSETGSDIPEILELIDPADETAAVQKARQILSQGITALQEEKYG